MKQNNYRDRQTYIDWYQSNTDYAISEFCRFVKHSKVLDITLDDYAHYLFTKFTSAGGDHVRTT